MILQAIVLLVATDGIFNYLFIVITGLQSNLHIQIHSS